MTSQKTEAEKRMMEAEGITSPLVAFGWLQLWCERAGVNPLKFVKLWELSFSDKLTGQRPPAPTDKCERCGLELCHEPKNWKPNRCHSPHNVPCTVDLPPNPPIAEELFHPTDKLVTQQHLKWAKTFCEDWGNTSKASSLELYQAVASLLASALSNEKARLREVLIKALDKRDEELAANFKDRNSPVHTDIIDEFDQLGNE